MIVTGNMWRGLMDKKTSKSNTSGMGMVEPPTEATVLPYFVCVGWATGKGEYGSSESLPGWTIVPNKALGKEFVYACWENKFLNQECHWKWVQIAVKERKEKKGQKELERMSLKVSADYSKRKEKKEEVRKSWRESVHICMGEINNKKEPNN